jgi:hypothetical protein
MIIGKVSLHPGHLANFCLAIDRSHEYEWQARHNIGVPI